MLPILLLFLIEFTWDNPVQGKETEVWDDDQYSLSCQSGGILIENVQVWEYCSGQSPFECQSHGFLDLFQKTCQGKGSCTSNLAGQDSGCRCPSHLNTFSIITYSCVEVSEICGNVWYSLSCWPDVILIKNVTVQRSCGNRLTQCHNHGFLDLLKTRCKQKGSCYGNLAGQDKICRCPNHSLMWNICSRITYSCVEDVNECLTGVSRCQHRCVNIPGSFRCKCNAGYRLSADSKTCQDIDECYMGSHLCNHICTNMQGSYTCVCKDGFRLIRGGTCLDVNECAMGQHGCNQMCHNHGGSYSCSCYIGYQLQSDTRTCLDVDECTTGVSSCDHRCVNIPGSFRCECDAAYRLSTDSRTCLGYNKSRCYMGSHLCNHICTNTQGSYTCVCKDGFRLIGVETCVDVNECAMGQHGCSQMCQNHGGSYSCSCYIGYQLQSDTRTCLDVDECTTGVSSCDHRCVNIDGSFQCECNAGYRLSADSKTCQVQQTTGAGTMDSTHGGPENQSSHASEQVKGNTGMIVGLVLGLLVLTAVIVVTIVLLLRRKKMKSKARSSEVSQNNTFQNSAYVLPSPRSVARENIYEDAVQDRFVEEAIVEEHHNISDSDSDFEVVPSIQPPACRDMRSNPTSEGNDDIYANQAMMDQAGPGVGEEGKDEELGGGQLKFAVINEEDETVMVENELYS